MVALFFVAAFLAEVIGTVAGFGSSTILLPVAVLFFDFKTALVLVAFMHIFGNIGRITFFKHGFDKRIILFFGLPSVALTLVGALLVLAIDQTVLKGLLGVFLVGYAAYALLRSKIKMPENLFTLALGGASSGFLAGLIGTGGVLRGAFLNAFDVPKTTYIASAAAVSLAVDLTRIPIYLSGGFLQQQFYWFVPLLFVLAIAGSFVGKKIVDKIPQEKFKRVVLVAIAAVGAVLVFDWLK
ncbi:MAG: sulfite exporter TauE/SafE family protein [Candidatus Saccharimonadales bacterium]